jgi:hypothetical protein
MTDLFLNVMPGLMAKYEYVHRLLKWAKVEVDNIAAHHNKSTVGYPVIEPLVLSSLERVSPEIGSVPLLQFIVTLRSLNSRIVKTNADPKNTENVIDLFLDLQDQMPALDLQLKRTLQAYALKSVLLFLALLALVVVPLVVLTRYS